MVVHKFRHDGSGALTAEGINPCMTMMQDLEMVHFKCLVALRPCPIVSVEWLQRFSRLAESEERWR
jgi:hypothetical protein